VRCIQWIGRRGLAKACVEGLLVSFSPYIAIIDGDLQHDEQLLPRVGGLESGTVDLVTRSGYVAGRGAVIGATGSGLAGSRCVLRTLSAIPKLLTLFGTSGCTAGFGARPRRYSICAVGAVANVGATSFAFTLHYTWWVAGVAGAVVGSVWNFAMFSVFTWRHG